MTDIRRNRPSAPVSTTSTIPHAPQRSQHRPVRAPGEATDSFVRGTARAPGDAQGTVTTPTVPQLPAAPDPKLHPGTDLADPLGEPTLMADTVKGAKDGQYTLMHTSGPLFGASGPQPSDINQGGAGDCYLLSSLAAIASTHPEAIKDLIHENPDGTFTVTLKSADGSGAGKPVTVNVDDEIYVENYTNASTGKVFGESAVYARGTQQGYQGNANPTYAQASTWVSLVEKAVAKTQNGSFDGIGHGGWPHDAMAKILGRPSTTFHTASMTPDQVWAKLSAASAAKDPTCASTYCDDASAANYTNTGIVHGHAYAVLGTSEHDGERFVQLRNPWGNTEPGNDGKNDGIFELKLADFVKYYDVVDSSPGPKTTPVPAPAPSPVNG